MAVTDGDENYGMEDAAFADEAALSSPMAGRMTGMPSNTEAEAEAKAAYYRFVGENFAMARKMVDRVRLRIAKKYGEDDRTWMRWENGERLPNLWVIARFCRDNGFTTDFIFLRSLSGMAERRRRKILKFHPELAHFRQEDVPLPPEPESPPMFSPWDWADDDYNAALPKLKRRRPPRRSDGTPPVA